MTAETKSIKAVLADTFDLAKTKGTEEQLANAMLEEVEIIAAVMADPRYLHRNTRQMIASNKRQKERVTDRALALRTAQVAEADRKLAVATPLVEKAEKFKPGRVKGSKSPIRRAIEKVLKKEPNATTEQVWDAIKLSPPRGYYCEGYLAGRALVHKVSSQRQTWGTFKNACSNARKELKITV